MVDANFPQRALTRLAALDRRRAPRTCRRHALRRPAPPSTTMHAIARAVDFASTI
jgi:hypothetical protein